MFSRIHFVLLSGLAACAGFCAGATPPSRLPDYAGLYDFETVAGSPAAGLRDNDSYYEPGQLDRVAYREPSAIIGDGAAEIVADTGNGALRLVYPDHSQYLLDPYYLTGAAGYPNTILFEQPSGLALTSDRVLYIAETGANRIHRYLLPNDFRLGKLTLFAGGAKAGNGNGVGRAARFKAPTALAVDQSGNVFVADTGNHVIRKITPSGVVTTLAGSPGKSGSADGQGARARFSSPRGIAADPAGNLYVSDTGNHLVRVIRPDGTVSTLAGLAASPGHDDGTGADARFSSPRGLRVRPDGKLIVADTGNHLLRLVSPLGAVSTLAGTPGVAGREDGPAASATFSSPSDVNLRPDGTVVIVDTDNHRLRTLSTNGVVATHSGLPGGSGFVDGAQSVSRLKRPDALSATTDALYFTDHGNQALRRLSFADHVVTTIAELPVAAGGGLAASQTGAVLYLTDPARHTLRAVHADGEASVVAGAIDTAGSADGTGPLSTFHSPRGMAVSRHGEVYIADSANHTVRRFDPASGAVDTVAGVAGQAGIADGSASGDARLRTPWALAFGPDDTLYILERDSRSLRTLSPEGVVATRYVDTAKHLDAPTTLAVDSEGNVVIGDSRNRLFILPPGGELGSLLDEKPGVGSEDVWPVRSENNATIYTARVDHPEALAFGPGDTLYVADTGNSLIRRGRPPLHRDTPSNVVRLDETNRSRLFLGNLPATCSIDQPAGVIAYLTGFAGDRHRYLQLGRTADIDPGVYPCTLRAELHDYTRVRSVDLHVLPANQAISLAPRYASYDGTPKAPAIVAAEGLTITSVLYDGLPTPPTEGGLHIVRVAYSINGATGTQDLEFFISQIDYPSLTIPSGPFVADGQPFNPLAGHPFGDVGTWTVRSGPAKIENNQVVLLAAGDVSLSYSLPNTPSYCGGGVTGTIQAAASPSAIPATINFAGLETTYDGEAKSVTITTEPPGLDVILRYPDRDPGQYPVPPITAGQYQVEAIVTTPGYSGYACATQKIAKASATLAAGPLANFVFGPAYRPQITTEPAGLAVRIRASGYFLWEDDTLSPGVHTISVELIDTHNYEPVEPVVFTQTVQKRPLVIRPVPAHRPVGASNPPITFSFDGLRGGMTPPAMPAPFVNAGPDSPPGVYAVKPVPPSQGFGLLKYYYDITLLDGTLEVHAYQGRYQTLLLSQRTGLPEALLTFKLDGPTGAFTGTLRYREETHPVKGRFAYATDSSAAGTATASWKLRYTGSALRNLDRLVLDITLSDTLQVRLVSYDETNRLPVSEQTMLHVSEPELRPLLNASGNPAVSFAGKHTLLFRQAARLSTFDDPAPPLASIPVGPGYATGEIDARGRLSLRGTLGDGRPFTGTLLSDATNTYRLFVNPYNRSESYLAGWLPLRPHPLLDGRLYLPDEDDQEIYWAKTASRKDEAYRNGFEPLTIHASLDHWRFFTEGFSATGLPSLPRPLVSASASMSLEPLEIDRRTGTFRGRATLLDQELADQLDDPALATRRFTIKGVLRQAPPGDNIVGAGLILLPAPGLKTKEAFTGQLLLKD